MVRDVLLARDPGLRGVGDRLPHVPERLIVVQPYLLLLSIPGKGVAVWAEFRPHVEVLMVEACRCRAQEMFSEAFYVQRGLTERDVQRVLWSSTFFRRPSCVLSGKRHKRRTSPEKSSQGSMCVEPVWKLLSIRAKHFMVTMGHGRRGSTVLRRRHEYETSRKCYSTPMAALG